MNLKRQLLLVSLLTLMLPWAGCEFIRQTESALRAGQQDSLAITARAHAGNLSQYVEEFPLESRHELNSDPLFIHPLTRAPTIDGYFDDWPLDGRSLRSIRGPDGPIRYAVGTFATDLYVYVDVADRNVLYAKSGSFNSAAQRVDSIHLISNSPPYLSETFVFAAEAPGAIVSYKQDNVKFESNNAKLVAESAIEAYWQDMPRGYHIEARLPKSLLGTDLGIVINNTDDATQRATRVRAFRTGQPTSVVERSPYLTLEAAKFVSGRSNLRLIVTDRYGWRLAVAGQLTPAPATDDVSAGWSRRIYGLLVEAGTDAKFADPDPHGRERQPYVTAALDGHERAGWFRSGNNGQAIVAVAAPVMNGNDVIGAVIMQQGTDAIISLTNQGLARLINLTLIVTVLVAGSLLGYASWLSRRIRYLSLAAENALEHEQLQTALPSALAGDEIGDLSRSFSHVLQQLGDYNTYLRSLASKLSHELRTPLAIVTSSLENLEHEPLNEAATNYTTRAREGADRLRRILSAMSEASRVEALVENVEVEHFDLAVIIASTTNAYRDVYQNRRIEYTPTMDEAPASGSPELLIQMLDKLVENAVDFSRDDDVIRISLGEENNELLLSIMNPGPPLPDSMRSQLFDSMVSMRSDVNTEHLGLGLHIARLIVTGHGGRIRGYNVENGVVFEVRLPRQDSR